MMKGLRLVALVVALVAVTCGYLSAQRWNACQSRGGGVMYDGQERRHVHTFCGVSMDWTPFPPLNEDHDDNGDGGGGEACVDTRGPIVLVFPGDGGDLAQSRLAASRLARSDADGGRIRWIAVSRPYATAWRASAEPMAALPWSVLWHDDQRARLVGPPPAAAAAAPSCDPVGTLLRDLGSEDAFGVVGVGTGLVPAARVCRAAGRDACRMAVGLGDLVDDATGQSVTVLTSPGAPTASATRLLWRLAVQWVPGFGSAWLGWQRWGCWALLGPLDVFASLCDDAPAWRDVSVSNVCHDVHHVHGIDADVAWQALTASPGVATAILGVTSNCEQVHHFVDAALERVF